MLDKMPTKQLKRLWDETRVGHNSDVARQVQEELAKRGQEDHCRSIPSKFSLTNTTPIRLLRARDAVEDAIRRFFYREPSDRLFHE